ncbi:hypothetical protein RI054_38g141520 [Pseudoscourfieldia marina]
MSLNSALLTRNQREQLEELAGNDSEHDVRVAATTALLDDAHGRLTQARELCTTPDGAERSPAFSSLLRRSEERVTRVGENLQQLVDANAEVTADQDNDKDSQDKDSQETLVLNAAADAHDDNGSNSTQGWNVALRNNKFRELSNSEDHSSDEQHPAPAIVEDKQVETTINTPPPSATLSFGDFTEKDITKILSDAHTTNVVKLRSVMKREKLNDATMNVVTLNNTSTKHVEKLKHDARNLMLSSA